MKKLSGQITILLLATLVTGVLANLLRPDRLPWVGEWGHYVETKALKEGLRLANTAEAKGIVDAGMHLAFDARSRADFEAGHLPMAFSVPFEEDEAAFDEAAMMLTPEQAVLVYCSGFACDESFQLSLMLRDNGFTNLVLYVGGMEAWREAGYPEEVGP